MAETTVTYEQGLQAHLEQHGFELKALTEDLIQYFSSNKKVRPPYIGKDAPFDRPENIGESEVHHLHMFIEGITDPQDWSSEYREHKRTSDSYLVYTFGFFNTDAYHVLGFVASDAHSKCRTNDDGYKLVRQFKYAADAFRDKC